MNFRLVTKSLTLNDLERRHWSTMQTPAERYQHLPTMTVRPTQKPSMKS